MMTGSLIKYQDFDDNNEVNKIVQAEEIRVNLAPGDEVLMYLDAFKTGLAFIKVTHLDGSESEELSYVIPESFKEELAVEGGS